MIIYKIENKINGMCYIGQTIQKLSKRITLHRNSTECPRISNALKKYGFKNFIIEIIDTATTLQELNDKEAYWIEKLNTLSPNGYNLSSSGSNSILSKETRLKMSEKLKGNKYAENLQHSEEFKKRQSLRYTGIGNPMYGKKQTLESIDKNKNSQKNARKISAYDKNNNFVKSFQSIKQASRELSQEKKLKGCISSNISKCLKKPLYTCGGYFWREV